ncbi:MAG: ornithine carbamoyltransferase [Candidatus Omnitrophica bacterium]|nr:ornithine carbamoyltransferase [Candidatus Omnitrophota bacterium]
MKKRDMVCIGNFKADEIFQLFESTKLLKQYKQRAQDHLKGYNIGLLFQKPSNRTRVSFEVGINQLGANCIYLGPNEINLGVRESAVDVAKTLSRYLDGIVARTNTHEDLIELTKNADIPVINGLSDFCHPCQGLADIFTIIEHKGKPKGINVAYIGDGNNVCHSLMLGCVKVGMNIAIAAPKGYAPHPSVIDDTHACAKKTKSKVTICQSPKEAVKNADVVYTDVWVSMGQENETEKRIKDFQDFQINEKLVKSAKGDFIFMHCLPAHRGQEVTGEVMDSKNSVVFDQAENRLHVQKAIMLLLFKS